VQVKKDVIGFLGSRIQGVLRKCLEIFKDEGIV
jgi:hypothetical protein